MSLNNIAGAVVLSIVLTFIGLLIMFSVIKNYEVRQACLNYYADWSDYNFCLEQTGLHDIDYVLKNKPRRGVK